MRSVRSVTILLVGSALLAGCGARSSVDCFGESCLLTSDESGSGVPEVDPSGSISPDDVLGPADVERPAPPDERPPPERVPVDTPLERPVAPDIDPEDRSCAVGGPVQGSVTVGDRATLEALEGCTVIIGDLEIAGEFADLAPLRALRRVTGVLRLSVSGTLNGLERLESVRGLALDAYNVPTLEPLSSVRQRGGSLSVTRGQGLRNLRGLELLDVVEIVLTENLTLQSLAGLRVPEQLEKLSIVRNPALRSLAALGSLVRADMVEIEGAAITNLAGLEGLQTVNTLVLASNVALGDTSQLARLQSVGVLYLDNVGLTSFVAPALASLTSAVIQNNPNLIEIDSLGPVAGLSELSVLDNPNLERLPAFPAVTELEQLYVRNNARLASGPGYPNASRVQTVHIQLNPSLTQLLGLSTVQTTRTLDITQNASLAELDLGALTSARDLRIMCNPALPETSLEPLRTLGAQVQITGNLGSASACGPEALDL